MPSDGAKPVLWVSLTSNGRHGNAADAMEEVQQTLRDSGLAEDYEIIVADDRVRLMDADEIQEHIQELTEHAAEFAHTERMMDALDEGHPDDVSGAPDQPAPADPALREGDDEL